MKRLQRTGRSRSKMVLGLQINIVQLKFLQASVNGLRYVLDVCYDFRRYEQLLSRYFALLDGKAHLFLGIVEFGGIEVVIS